MPRNRSFSLKQSHFLSFTPLPSASSPFYHFHQYHLSSQLPLRSALSVVRTRRVCRCLVKCLHEVLTECLVRGGRDPWGRKSRRCLKTAIARAHRQEDLFCHRPQSFYGHIESLPFTTLVSTPCSSPLNNRLRIDHRVYENNPPQWQPTTVQVSKMITKFLSQSCIDVA